MELVTEDTRVAVERRALSLLRHLEALTDDNAEPTNFLHLSQTSASGGRGGSNQITVRIGDVSLVRTKPPHALMHTVPARYLTSAEDQETLRTMRFLMQKDSLGQDVYLIGPPGPLRRNIVMKYAELTKRTVQFVPLSADTTESDLKQRREITKGTAVYFDCAATTAAINGSLLILDGVEKAERNVLVILNNLCENREMALEDGRFLVNPKRYDALLKDHSVEELTSWKLIRTSDQFRVIALGLPIPRYMGSPLDPPFRSRFQAKDVQGPRISEILSRIKPESRGAEFSLKSLLQASAVIREMRESDGTSVSAISAIPEFPQAFEDFVARVLALVPELSPSFLVPFVFPHVELLRGVADDRLHVVRKVFRRFGLEDADAEKGYSDGLGEPEDAIKQQLAELQFVSQFTAAQVAFAREHWRALVSFNLELESAVSSGVSSVAQKQVTIPCAAGKRRVVQPTATFVPTPSTEAALARMLLAHSAGQDICLVGDKGGGKSRLTMHFADILGYRVEHIPMYKDFSARQLLQRRATSAEAGDTIWEDSPLVRAALQGSIAVLDGIEQMAPGTIGTLQNLVGDRDCPLPDGKRRLIAQDRFDHILKRDSLTREELVRRGFEPIHPSFRVICLARPSNLTSGSSSAAQARAAWLLPEITTMFRFVYLHPVQHSQDLLRKVCPQVTEKHLAQLDAYSTALRAAIAKDDTLATLETTISIRQTVRVCWQISAADAEENEAGSLRKSLEAAALDRFLPPITREVFHSILDSVGITKPEPTAGEEGDASDEESWRITMLPPVTPGSIGVLKVGKKTRVDVFPPRDPLLVPSIVFYDNPRQTRLLGEMLRDWKAGQHLLLIGNQGVGKNKLADRMLQWMQLPREYIQLHRDTTVQNLTSNPTIVNGRLIFEDSPLVKAVRTGRVLVVDECDKAPTYVTAILKSLIEDKQMLLGDGKRIVSENYVADSAEDEAEVIRVHPEFRVIALANRPGFPFHGNAFMGEVGDVFACHTIDNPDPESEFVMMREYGPSVPVETLRKLVRAFDELRQMSDEGKLTYPYSTRELAAVVKHMEAFPREGIASILRNVFDFDNYLNEEKQLLIQVFAKHGIPFSLSSSLDGSSQAPFEVKTGDFTSTLSPPRLLECWTKSMSISMVQQQLLAPFDKVARYNHGTGSIIWNLRREPLERGMVQIKQRSSDFFSEEKYSFKLSRLTLVLGCANLSDGRLVLLGRSSAPGVAFAMYVMDATHQHFESYDLFAALPSEGTYRTPPRLASVLVTERDEIVIAHPESKYLLVVDLATKSLLYFDALPGVVKNKSLRLAKDAVSNQTLWFQPGSNALGVLDFSRRVHVAAVVPNFEVQNAHALSARQWLLVDANLQSVILTLSEQDSKLTYQVVDKRDATQRAPPAQLAKLGVIGAQRLRNAPGSLKEASALMYADATVGFSANQGEQRINLYTVPKPASSVPNAHVARLTKGLMMDKSQLFVTSVERTDLFQVDIQVYDLEQFKSRAFSIHLQDDIAPPTGGGAPASLKDFNFKKPLTALSPSDLSMFNMVRQAIADSEQRIFMLEHPDGESLITIDCLGTVRVFHASELALRRAFADWRKLLGLSGDGLLQQELEAQLKVSVEEGNGSSGKGQGEGEGEGEGKGKGTGTGEGEGEGDGAGVGAGEGGGNSGSSGGPVKGGGGAGTGTAKGKKKFEDISELPDPGEFKAERRGEELLVVPETAQPRAAGARGPEDMQAKLAAQEMKKQEFAEMLQKINMSEFDSAKYNKYLAAVSTEIRELRSVLESLESKDQERVWNKNQLVGDLDDQKLIDGLSGEKNVYKRRMDADPNNPFFTSKPKLLSFVFDVSMSMSRYASDGRLERSLEAAVMVMEALKGFERKFDYRITGHSGDTDELKLVNWSKPPKNEKERLDIIKAMHAHTETCDSGDYTLEAARKAIFEVAAQKEADDRFVFLISDANLDQYSITHEMVARLFDLDQRVHVFILFIANQRDSAAALAKKMPSNVFVCLDKSQMPKVMKRMFLAAAAKA